MAVDYNDIYNYYLNSFSLEGEEQPEIKAAEYTAYQRLTGSKKNPPKWYSEQEWLEYEAPAYIEAITYDGSDELSTTLKAELEAKGGDLKFDDVRTIATNLADVSAKNDLGLTYADIYPQVKEIYEQRESAKRKYENQRNTHVYSQYGLPDPNLRFGVDDDPNNNQVAFPGVKDWIVNKANVYRDSLIKKGVSRDVVETRVRTYAQSLRTEIDKKIKASNVTPFVYEAAKRYRSR